MNKQSPIYKYLKNQEGAITVIFLAVVALVLTLILATTQSQLLLSLRRSQSAYDILVATYGAESEVNDIMARLHGGYLKSADIPKFTKNVGDIRLEIEGEEEGDTQTVTVTALRGFAVGKVQAVRKLATRQEVSDVDIVLMLDCTGSMNDDDGSGTGTRFDALERAAVNFIDRMESLPDSDKFNLGVGVFGIDAKWMRSGGVEITPGSGLALSEIRRAIEDGFNSTDRQSPPCLSIMDATSIGTAFSFAHDYFAVNKSPGKKQIEIVITDGQPNSRIPDARCSPDLFCPGESSSTFCQSNPYGWSCPSPFSQGMCNSLAERYLSCTVADTNTFVPEINQNGIRDPEVDAYAVTIFRNPPVRVVDIFRNYATKDGYFNAARATELTGILEGILDRIIDERSSITVKRLIPTPQ